MTYKVTFKGHDDEGKYVEREWTFTNRGDADRKYCEVFERSEWGDKVRLKVIGE